MNPFTEEPLTNFQDWGAVLVSGCGCCEMPACPIPLRENQSLYGSSRVAFALRTGSSPNYDYWRTRRFEYSDGGQMERHAPATHWTVLGGVWIEDAILTDNYFPPYTGEITTVWEDAITPDDSRADGFAAIMAYPLDWDAMTQGSQTYASRTDIHPLGIPATTLNVYFHRFRWVIPSDFEGSYFKITWDIVEFPSDGDPVAVLTNQTWEWTGPGDPEDPDSWKSPWWVTEPPAQEGQRRIVNIRYECYRGPYGSLPDVLGEQIELPAP